MISDRSTFLFSLRNVLVQYHIRFTSSDSTLLGCPSMREQFMIQSISSQKVCYDVKQPSHSVIEIFYVSWKFQTESPLGRRFVHEGPVTTLQDNSHESLKNLTPLRMKISVPCIPMSTPARSLCSQEQEEEHVSSAQNIQKIQHTRTDNKSKTSQTCQPCQPSKSQHKGLFPLHFNGVGGLKVSDILMTHFHTETYNQLLGLNYII